MPHIKRGPIASVIGPAASVPISVKVMHEAAEHGEDLAAPVVRHDLLDQRHVADEADAVPDPEDDCPDAADRKLGADGADRDAGRGDQERGAIAAVDRQPLDEPHRDDVADQDPAGRERHEDAEAGVAGPVRLGREHDLGDVDAGVGERRPAPDQEDRRQVGVVADEREPGPHLAPVGAADPGRNARLEPRRRSG